MKLPMAYGSADYFSKKSRADLINLMVETNKDGDFIQVRPTDGLVEFSDDNAFAVGIRSNLHLSDDRVFYVILDELRFVNSSGTVSSAGTLNNNSGRAFITSMQGPTPSDPQVIILDGAGDGYVYTTGGGLVQITDVNFPAACFSLTVLNEQVYAVRNDSTQIQVSQVGDATNWTPAIFFQANEKPDNALAVIANQGAIWVFCEETTEYWRSVNDPNLPVRRTIGGTKERGIVSIDSLTEYDNKIFWLADDLTVRMLVGTQMTQVSDLDFAETMEGRQGSVVSGAIGFFIDDDIHKMYCLTFFNIGYTWLYDLTTGKPHRRFTPDENLNVWRGVASTRAFDRVLIADTFQPKIYFTDNSVFTEDGITITRFWTTPSIYNEKNFTIPLIEFDMEVAKDATADSFQVEYTKDGGNNFFTHSDGLVGTTGEDDTRVPLREFGRVVRNKDFFLRITVNEAIDFSIYNIVADVQVSGF